MKNTELEKVKQELYLLKEYISTIAQDVRRLNIAASIHYTDVMAHNEPFSIEAQKIIDRGKDEQWHLKQGKNI